MAKGILSTLRARADDDEKARLEAEEQARLDAAKAAEDDESEDEKDMKGEDKDKHKMSGKSKAEEDDGEKEDDEEMAAADPAVVARMCHEAGAPDKAEGLIKRKATLAEVKAALESAADIRQLCAYAARINPALDAKAMAADFERGNASAAHAGEVLLETLAGMQSPEIANRHSAAPSSASGRVQAGNHGWDQVIEKVSNQFKPPQAPTH